MFVGTLNGLVVWVGGMKGPEVAGRRGAAGVVPSSASSLSPPGRNLIRRSSRLQRGADAYLIGYPLVTMNGPAVADRRTGPGDQRLHHALPPDRDQRRQCRGAGPGHNLSSAWLDLRDGQCSSEQPDMGERFWLMPCSISGPT